MSETPYSSGHLDEAAYYSWVLRGLKAEYAEMVLLGGLYGVLTLLSFQSARALTQSKTRRTKPTSIILCLIILALFTSTTIYLVVYILYIQYDDAISTVASHASPVDLNKFTQEDVDNIILKYHSLYNCAGTSALTINVVLGDAIVCWRTSVIWERKRMVRAICGVFLLVTFVLGVIDTADTCAQRARIGQLYLDTRVGIAVCVLSLSTNLLATLLVGYKAWQSRRRLKEYFLHVVGSQVEELLALLIESGAVYCTIWGVIVAYQIISYDVNASANQGLHESSGEAIFTSIWSAFINSVLIPLVAIYPMIIIVLVAFNKSHIENGLSQNLSSLPTPQLTFRVNTVVTRESASH